MRGPPVAFVALLVASMLVGIDPVAAHPAPALGSVTPLSTPNQSSNTVTLNSLAAPAGNDRVLVVAIDYFDGTGAVNPTPVTSVTWNGLTVAANGGMLCYSNVLIGGQQFLVTACVAHIRIGSSATTTTGNLVVQWQTNTVASSWLGAAFYQNIDQVVGLTVGGTLGAAGPQYTSGNPNLNDQPNRPITTTRRDSRVFGTSVSKGTQAFVFDPEPGTTEILEHVPGATATNDVSAVVGERQVTTPGVVNFGWQQSLASTGLPTVKDWALVAVELVSHPRVRFDDAYEVPGPRVRTPDPAGESSQYEDVTSAAVRVEFEYGWGSDVDVLFWIDEGAGCVASGSTTACRGGANSDYSINLSGITYINEVAGAPTCAVNPPAPPLPSVHWRMAFSPGTTFRDIPISIVQDRLPENNEEVRFRLCAAAPSSAVSPPASSFHFDVQPFSTTHTFVILDDDVTVRWDPMAPATTPENTDASTPAPGTVVDDHTVIVNMQLSKPWPFAIPVRVYYWMDDEATQASPAVCGPTPLAMPTDWRIQVGGNHCPTRTPPGIAGPGTHYVVFSQGQQNAPVTIQIEDDTIFEAIERLSLVIPDNTNPANDPRVFGSDGPPPPAFRGTVLRGTPHIHHLNITDDDPMPVYAVEAPIDGILPAPDAEGFEGDPAPASHDVFYTLVRTGYSQVRSCVSVTRDSLPGPPATLSGPNRDVDPATSGALGIHCIPANPLAVPPLRVETPHGLTILHDEIAEFDETVRLALVGGSAVNATIGAANAAVYTIVNDDIPGIRVTFQPPDDLLDFLEMLEPTTSKTLGPEDRVDFLVQIDTTPENPTVAPVWICVDLDPALHSPPQSRVQSVSSMGACGNQGVLLRFNAGGSPATAQTVSVTAVDDYRHEDSPHPGDLRVRVVTPDSDDLYEPPNLVGFYYGHMPGESALTANRDTIDIAITDEDVPGFHVTVSFDGGNSWVDFDPANHILDVGEPLVPPPGFPAQSTLYRMHLDTEPRADVNLCVEPESLGGVDAIVSFPGGTPCDADMDGTQDGVWVIFTPMRFEGGPPCALCYNVEHVVTITAVDDAVHEPDAFDPTPTGDQHAERLLYRVSTMDPHYANPLLVAVPSPLPLRVWDDDVPGVTITPAGPYVVDEADEATPATFTVELDSEPSGDVDVTLTLEALVAHRDASFAPCSGGRVATLVLTFTPGGNPVVAGTTSDWNVPQTVSIYACDDMILEGDGGTVWNDAVGDENEDRLTFGVSGADGDYDNSVAPPAQVIRVLDNEVAQVILQEPGSAGLPPTLTVSETDNGGTPASDTFEVVLSAQPLPGATIRITLAETIVTNEDLQVVLSSLTTQCTLPAPAPDTLCFPFTDANWNVPRLVTVTARPDQRDNGDRPVQIAVTGTGPWSTPHPSQSVNVLDDDTRSLRLTQNGAIVTVGTTATHTAVYENPPAPSVPGNYQAGDSYELVLGSEPYNPARPFQSAASERTVTVRVSVMAISSGDIELVGPQGTSVAAYDMVFTSTAGQAVTAPHLLRQDGGWNVARTIQVMAVNDDYVEDDVLRYIEHRVLLPGESRLDGSFVPASTNAGGADPNYDASAANNAGPVTGPLTFTRLGEPSPAVAPTNQIVVAVRSNDVARVQSCITPPVIAVAEGLTSTTFGVRLTSEPRSNVVVRLTLSDPSAPPGFGPRHRLDLGGSLSTTLDLTFTDRFGPAPSGANSHWNQPIQIGIRAAEDRVDWPATPTDAGTYASVTVEHQILTSDIHYSDAAAWPASCDVELTTDNDDEGVEVSLDGVTLGASLSIAESNAGPPPRFQDYLVRLTSRPTGAVTLQVRTEVPGDASQVQLMSSNDGTVAGLVASDLLDFDATTWDTWHRVRVTAVDDLVAEWDDDAGTSGVQDVFRLEHRITTSLSLKYDVGDILAPVEVSILDDDIPAIVILDDSLTPDDLAVTLGETGIGPTSLTVRVKLDTQPTAPVTVHLQTPADPDCARLVAHWPATLTFTPGTNDAFDGTDSGWNVAQDVTLTVAEDERDNRPEDVVCTLPHDVSSADPLYDAAARTVAGLASLATHLLASVLDDDTAGLLLTPPTLSGLLEGDTRDAPPREIGLRNSYLVRLRTLPTEPVTVRFYPDAQVAITLDPTALLKQNSDTEFVLPDADFVDQAEAAGTPFEVTFTADGAGGTVVWNVGQRVYVLAVDDDALEGTPHPGAVSHQIVNGRTAGTTLDGYFDGLAVPSLSADLQDNDTPGVLMDLARNPADPTPGEVRLAEAGGVDRLHVRLTIPPEPGASVTVCFEQEHTLDTRNGIADLRRDYVLSGGDAACDLNGDGTLEGQAFTFLPGNYHVWRELLVTGDPDFVVEGDLSILLDRAVTAAPGDINYAPLVGAKASAVDAEPLTPGHQSGALAVTVLDDDVAAIGVTPLRLSDGGRDLGVTETNAPSPTGRDSVAVVLSSQPEADVVVTVTVGSGTACSGLGATTSAASLTFAPADWNTPQPVEVSACQDAVAEGPRTDLVVFRRGTATVDSVYAALTVPSDTADAGDPDVPARLVRRVQMTDDDTAGVLVLAGACTMHVAGATSPSAYDLANRLRLQEGGTDETVCVRLTSQPVGDVRVTLGLAETSPTNDEQAPPVLDAAFGSEQATTLVLTGGNVPTVQGNWATGLNIRLRGLGDRIAERTGAEPDEVERLTLVMAPGTADTTYRDMILPPVDIAIADVDVAGLVVEHANVLCAPAAPELCVDEAPGAMRDAYVVGLASIAQRDVTVTVTASGQVDLSLDNVNWAGSRSWVIPAGTDPSARTTVRVRGIEDVVAEGVHAAVLQHRLASADRFHDDAASPNPTAIRADVPVRIIDNDVPGVVFLAARDDCPVPLTPPGCPSGHALAPAGPGDIEVSEEDDEGNNPVPPSPLSSPMFVRLATEVQAGRTAIVRIRPATSDMTATFGGATVDHTGQLDLTFTGADWNVGKEITLRAPGDDQQQGVRLVGWVVEMLGDDPQYNALSVTAPLIRILDEDSPGLILSRRNVAICENASPALPADCPGLATSADIMVRLAVQPAQTVTVRLEPAPLGPAGPRPFAVTATAATAPCPSANPHAVCLTFEPGNFATPQALRVTALDDRLDEGVEDAILHLRTTSDQAEYDEEARLGLGLGSIAETVTVRIHSDDHVGLEVVQNGASVTLSPGVDARLLVAEGTPQGIYGANDHVHVRLTAQPRANVQLNVGHGAEVLPASLQFTFQAPAWNPATASYTGGDWDAYQVVSLSAVDDLVVDGKPHADALQLTATGDSQYGLLPATVLPVGIWDNDVYNVLFEPSVGTFARVDEDGATDTVGVRLASRPASDVWVFLMASPAIPGFPGSTQAEISGPGDPCPGSAPPGAHCFLFTPANFYTPRSFTTLAFDDPDMEGSHVGYVHASTASLDPNYDGMGPAPGPKHVESLLVLIEDNDTPAVDVAELAPATRVEDRDTLVAEATGTPDLYRLRLTTRPEADVVVRVRPEYLPGAVLPQLAEQVEISSDGLTWVRPSATPIELRFLPANGAVLSLDGRVGGWDVDHLIWVRAINDGLREASPHLSVVRHEAESVDPAYHGLSVADVFVRIVDDDLPVVHLDEPGGSTRVAECNEIQDGLPPGACASRTDVYRIVLGTQPTSDVYVGILESPQLVVSDLVLVVCPPGAGPGIVCIRFTPTDWATPQVVAVAAVDDADVEATPVGYHEGLLRHYAWSLDSDYGDAMNDPGRLVGVVTVRVVDNDSPGIFLQETGSMTRLDEGGALTDTYRAVLTRKPLDTVRVHLSFDTTDAAIASPTTLTFAPDAATLSALPEATLWTTWQTVTLATQDDDRIEPTVVVPVVHTVSGDAEYTTAFDGVPLHVEVELVSDDTPDILVRQTTTGSCSDASAPAETRVTEGGALDAICVRLAAQPAYEVRVAFTRDEQFRFFPQEPLYDRFVMAFYPGDWNLEQQLEIAAVDDAVDEADAGGLGAHVGLMRVEIATPDTDFQAARTRLDGAFIGDRFAVHVVDNDDLPAASFAIGSGAHAEDAGDVQVGLRLSHPSDRAIRVRLTITGGSAAVGNAGAGDVCLAPCETTRLYTFAPRTTEVPATLRVHPDEDLEFDETVHLSLAVEGTDPATLGSPSAHIHTILADDPGRVCIANGAAVNPQGRAPCLVGVTRHAFLNQAQFAGTYEGGHFVLPLRLDRVPAGPVTVHLSTGSPTQATVEAPTSLTFTPDDFDVVRFVRVYVALDGVQDGNLMVDVHSDVDPASATGFAGIPRLTVPFLARDVDGAAEGGAPPAGGGGSSGGSSAGAMVVPPAPPPAPAPAPVAPPAPPAPPSPPPVNHDLTSTLTQTLSSGDVQLSWPSVSGALGYQVWVQNDDGSWTLAADVERPSARLAGGPRAVKLTYYTGLTLDEGHATAQTDPADIPGWDPLDVLPREAPPEEPRVRQAARPSPNMVPFYLGGAALVAAALGLLFFFLLGRRRKEDERSS